jgi:hypothetical protein
VSSSARLIARAITHLDYYFEAQSPIDRLAYLKNARELVLAALLCAKRDREPRAEYLVFALQDLDQSIELEKSELS